MSGIFCSVVLSNSRSRVNCPRSPLPLPLSVAPSTSTGRENKIITKIYAPAPYFTGIRARTKKDSFTAYDSCTPQGLGMAGRARHMITRERTR
ncbi:hypothetical protein P167DRAFT_58222 [Morchella conica CCBAS932]|uniref:Uncharacterized protein n=1 Tax=Morchella conica CCBAS932 TaxID=1392247 RepID=A0A3N4KVP4_9PEZI|nr:hypothetical protein P167DRAFT_58222 [Morchella conica CCBAS932]